MRPPGLACFCAQDGRETPTTVAWILMAGTETVRPAAVATGKRHRRFFGRLRRTGGGCRGNHARLTLPRFGSVIVAVRLLDDSSCLKQPRSGEWESDAGRALNGGNVTSESKIYLGINTVLGVGQRGEGLYKRPDHCPESCAVFAFSRSDRANREHYPRYPQCCTQARRTSCKTWWGMARRWETRRVACFCAPDGGAALTRVAWTMMVGTEKTRPAASSRPA
jgi:hypothetical protein